MNEESKSGEPIPRPGPRRSSWEHQAIKRLHTEGNRYPDAKYLRSLYEDARKFAGIAPVGEQLAQDNHYHKWLNSIISRGYLLKVQRDFYLNYTDPEDAPGIKEIAHILRPSAIISLQTVYGASIGNNPSRMATCVIRSDTVDAQKPRAIHAKTKHRGETFGWDFRFYSMEPALYEAGQLDDRLNLSASYPIATPERALCDMLALSADGRNSMTMTAMFEADLSDLDEDRMGRLVEAMDIRDLYADFLAQVPSPDEDNESDPSIRGYGW